MNHAWQKRAIPKSQSSGVWWLSPFWLIAGFLVPLFLAIMFLGESNSRALTVRGHRFLDLEYSLIGASLIALMGISAFIGERIKVNSPYTTPIADLSWKPVAWTLGLISLAAYIAWFREIIFSPTNLFGVLTGTVRFGRADLDRSVGLASLANFMPIFFALLAHVWAKRPSAIGRGLFFLAGTLFALTLLRVYVWSERLALIELAVAIVVPYIAAKQASLTQAQRKVLVLAPLYGIPIVMLFFGATEYFRSWQSDFYKGTMPFWEFAIGRFASYYYTSLNNGAGLLATQEWPTFQLETTLQFAIKAPGIFGALYQYYTNFDGSNIGPFLTRYADPEFNNPSGIYAVLFEIGPTGAVLYFTFLGIISGLFYRCLMNDQAIGVVLYPMTFVMMLELYRYPYFGSTRAFTSFLGAALVIYLLHRAQKNVARATPTL